MRCRYGDNCKYGGEVDKKIAVKDGNAYYHKECLKEKKLKQQIEEYYMVNMPSTTLAILRKVIKQLLNNNKSAEYILFTLKYIKKNNKPINNPFGLMNYCNDYKIYEEFKKDIIDEKYKELKNNISKNIYIHDDVKFTYKPKNKKITDII